MVTPKLRYNKSLQFLYKARFEVTAGTCIQTYAGLKARSSNRLICPLQVFLPSDGICNNHSTVMFEEGTEKLE